MRIYVCNLCTFETKSFVPGSKMQEYMNDSMNKHMLDQHTCKFCKSFKPNHYTTTFRTRAGVLVSQHWTKQLERHEEACKLKQMKNEKHNALLRQHEQVKKARQVARDKMLPICLAEKQSPIAILTDDVLLCVFKHLCIMEK